LAKEGRVRLDFRAEFFNIFNRLYLANPAPVSAAGFPPPGPNPAAPTVRNQQTGALVSGYGFVNTFNGNGSQPRTGQIVARFTF
jgi:hypothetical protein